MNEVKISSVSKNYAKALAEIAAGDNSFDLLKSQLLDIITTIKNSEDLKIIMENSSITSIKKLEILQEIFHGKTDERILNLLKILIDKNRFSELEGIYQAYLQQVNKYTNTQNVEIISAIDLPEDVKEKILNKLENKLKCSVLPSWTTDEDIIAGLTFRFQDFVIDTSIKSDIEKFSKHMLR